MAIVQIGPYPLSGDCIHGGVEASVYGLTQALVRAGHVVDVFDYPRIGGKDSIERNGALTLHRYANTGTHNEDAMQRGKELFRDVVALHPDVVHVHGTGKLSGAIYQAVQNYGIPVVLTVHGLLHEEKKQALRRKPSLKALYQYIVQSRAEFGLLNETTQIIVDTEYVAEMIKKYHAQGRIKHLPQMEIIPQGINHSYYGLTCDCKSQTILSVGAISPRKGHIYTLEMFNSLRNRGVDAQLRIIGSLADRHYYECLVHKISESPYNAAISLEPNLSSKELFNAYTQAKLFVLHSREESQGIVFAEAMAAGLPVVATNVGGIPYVVPDGYSGLLCPYGDVETMTDMVERLMTVDTLWQQFSDSARRIAKGYDWDKIAEQVIKLYKQK